MKEYKKKKPLTRENADFDMRHLPIAGGGAPLVALLGGDKDEQVEANWDSWKLAGGTLGGYFGLGALGGAAGYGIGKAVDGEQGAILGTGLGALAGALGGSLLGQYITFKTMAKNRDVDDTYDVRHIPFLGGGAPIAALHGYSPEDQVESNWNALKIGVPSTVAGLAGNAVFPGVGILTSNATGAGMYSALKNSRMKKDRDN